MTTRSCRWGAGRGHYDPWIDVYKTALLETDWSIIEERSKLQIPRLMHDYTNRPSITVAHPKKINESKTQLHGLSVLRREVAEWHRSQAGKRA